MYVIGDAQSESESQSELQGAVPRRVFLVLSAARQRESDGGLGDAKLAPYHALRGCAGACLESGQGGASLAIPEGAESLATPKALHPWPFPLKL
eukprot:359687-Chlamydomonas_euryale.AAC.4